ncbi:DUF1796 family putative cysteine peptidase [Lichenicola sp.]|uniref:DUF1796 family putative cysteine peptidase n=1 Tax=Lichenicola sp. TaxID=2804529 RepID=UPI003AFF945E
MLERTTPAPAGGNDTLDQATPEAIATLQPSATLTMPFRFVSLGSDCQAGHQLRRVQVSNTSGVFDFVTTQTRHLIRLIENDFAGFLDLENMFPVYHDVTFIGAVDTRYRIGFNHDFAKLDKEDVDYVRTLYSMRIRWFRNLFDPRRPPPYFIRRHHPRDGYADESLAIALFELLRKKRSDIRFLYLHGDPERREFMMDGFRSAFLRQHEPFAWQGDDAAWTEILGHFAIKPFAGDRIAFPLPEMLPEMRPEAQPEMRPEPRPETRKPRFG